MGWVPQFSILKSSNLVEDKEIVSLPKKLICQGMRAEKDYHQSRSSKAFLASLQRTFSTREELDFLAGVCCLGIYFSSLCHSGLLMLTRIMYPIQQAKPLAKLVTDRLSPPNLSSHLGPFTSYLCFVFISFLYSLMHVSCICSPSPHSSLFLISFSIYFPCKQSLVITMQSNWKLMIKTQVKDI